MSTPLRCKPIRQNGSGLNQKELSLSEESSDLIEQLPAAIYTCDKEGRITFYNRAAATLWGRHPEIGIDLWCGSWKIYQPDGTPMLLEACPMAVTLQQGVAVKDQEIIVERPDGVRVHVLPHPHPVFDSEGKISGGFNMLVDITGKKAAEERIRKSEQKYRALAKSLEEKVEKRTLELKKKNEELEQYASIASHDLQEPLRKIQTFAGLLENNPDDKQGVKKNLDKIKDSAKRMTVLIKDILKYSRLSDSDKQLAPTDLNMIIREIIEGIDLQSEQKNIKINHTALPVISAISIQMQQLFSNLISNAVKFSDKNPVIDISAEIPGSGEIKNASLAGNKEYVKITVRDNGRGFEPQYAEQVFKLFKRLTNKESGTGIGLALCKKIVENHHGHISVSSEVNKGTCFTILLPGMLN